MIRGRAIDCASEAAETAATMSGNSTLNFICALSLITFDESASVGPAGSAACCARWRRSFPRRRSGTPPRRISRRSGRTCSAPPRRLHPLDELAGEPVPHEGSEERLRRRETDLPAEAARLAQGERDPRRVDELRIADVDDIGERDPLLVGPASHTQGIALVEHSIREILAQ